MPNPIKLPLPATIQAFYGGNQLPSRNFDASNYGRHLTEVGTVSTPKLPAPPEGDQWLLGGSSPANHWVAPNSAALIGFGLQGMVGFKMIYHDSVSAQANIFNIESDNFYGMRFEVVPDNGGKIRFVFARGASNYITIEIPNTMVNGTEYEWRMEFREDGTHLIKDGVEVGYSNFNPAFPSITEFIIGDKNSPNLCFVDAFMVSTKSNEPFPQPQALPPAVTGFTGYAT